MKVGDEPPPLYGPSPPPSGRAPPPKVTSKGKPGRGAVTTKRQSSHRFQALNVFRDSGALKAGLGPSERLVWMVLWSCVDARTGLARVSYQALAKKTGLGPRQALRVVRELIARRFITVETRGGPKNWQVNAYRLNPEP